MRFPRRSNLIIAAATLAVLVLAAEVVLRVAAPVADPTRPEARNVSAINPYIRFEYPKHYATVTEPEPGLLGVEGRHSFTTNAYGFRGDSLDIPKPAGEFRIFVIGGSTAECFYLDDDDDMSRVAQDEMAAHAKEARSIKVHNVGLSGAASDDHVAMLAQRLVHLEPDLVVVFAGFNDLRRSLQGFDYLHYTTYGAAPALPCYKRWLLGSQIMRRVAYASRRVHPDPKSIMETRPFKSDYARKIAVQRAAPETDATVRVDTTSYRNNLRSMVGIARANRFALVFMTHPSTWNSAVDPAASDRHWMRVYDGVVYREGAMDSALERLNDTMRAVAAQDSVPLYDLTQTLPKSLEFLYDDCHFTREGALATGRGLARFLMDRTLVPAAGAPSAEGGNGE
jgi:lysophospholipase L1-like esterase